ncbi:SUA5 [Enterospora canceri]|uniref:Threonylcarbamoyl-AMP synthase n=1 Tax=Enterospora canceri TaxID=1081671 RepID=A0A1Y1S8K1_9MICR|nr:SUA5 [Enterospora canceri]
MKTYKLEDFNNKDHRDKMIQAFNKAVVIPTETVYGLAGRIDNETALRDIYTIKGRASDNPLILLVSNRKMLKTVIKGEIPPKYQKLIDLFWPGPLSLIFMADETLSSTVRGSSLKTVAIRMPENKTLLELIDVIGVPLAAPSANTSGQPSPTEVSHAQNDLKNKVETYIDGGKCSFGLESTVFMGLGDENVILRPGSITPEQIEMALGEEVRIKNKADGTVVICPGTKYTHYSPKVDVVLFIGSNWLQNMIREVNRTDQVVGVMASEDVLDQFDQIKNVKMFNMGSSVKMCASNCFSGFRKLENEVEIIFVRGFEQKGEGCAIMDRLEKASSKIVE